MRTVHVIALVVVVVTLLGSFVARSKLGNDTDDVKRVERDSLNNQADATVGSLATLFMRITETHRVMFIGDSITQGLASTTAGRAR